MEDYASSDEDFCYVNSDEEDRFLEDLTPFASTSASASASQSDLESVKVITKESLLAAQGEDLRKIMEVLSLKEHHARTVLIYYRWDVEKVMSALVENGKDELCAKSGVIEYLSPQILPPLVMCIICMEEVTEIEVTIMDCGHYFCNNCWTEHFIVKINEGQSRRIRCMAHRCDSVCDEAKVRELVSVRDPNLAEKFERFLLESFIEDNEKVKWCPSVPHCGNALRIGEDGLCEVECTCGVKFCFGCLSEAHSPCTCKMWALWGKKCEDESETVNWMTVNTKPCPKCLKMVEKNGGCNLMTCVCHQTFCWHCGVATGTTHTYDTIMGHSCGRLGENKTHEVEKARKYLYRYIHYHNRYKAHSDSFKLESKMTETMKEKIKMLEEKNDLSVDFSWLTNGLFRLFRSRQILSYTYAFAFYMFGEFGEDIPEKERERKKILFEDHQQQLEMHIEWLSSCLEKNFKESQVDEIMEVRMQIITLTVLVDKLCGKLYDCIENDLLAYLKSTTQKIAPYKSEGVNKASEFGVENCF